MINKSINIFLETIYKSDLQEFNQSSNNLPKIENNNDDMVWCVGKCDSVCFCKAGECGCKGCQGVQSQNIRKEEV